MTDDTDNSLRPAEKAKKRRSKTISGRTLTQREVLEGKALQEWMDIRRPRTRGDCRDGLRPCPFVGCKYHLYLDVNPDTHSIKKNFPHKDVWELDDTCALDVAERGGLTLEEVGELLNLTRERIRQMEAVGVKRLSLNIGEPSS
jgi:hypothetical protein